MISKWFDLKRAAIDLRRSGQSISNIESQLHIPRSTLSGWFRSVILSPEQKEELDRQRRANLVKTREKASEWHHSQKLKRIQDAENYANNFLKKFNFQDTSLIELSLAMLYLGEGFKKSYTTGLGSSDPTIMAFFLKCIRILYNINDDQLRVTLYLRADQNPNNLKWYWSSTLKLPLDCFRWVYNDRRTEGSKTYAEYKGVCTITCGHVDIERKLVYIGKQLCQKVIEVNLNKLQRAVSSVG